MSESAKNGSSPVGDATTEGKADRSKAESAKATGSAARSASKATSGAAAKTGSAARGVKSSATEAGEGAAALSATLGAKTKAKAKAGGELLSAVPGKTLQAATTTWTLLKNRKAIAMGVGSGAVAMLAGAYALGGANVRRGQGPLTRATRGVL
ncbi:hypothetical protein [Streptomyces sp. NPDC029674]|uniref:hypothetical protein n=1 Tax=Streptomyces sp. NPDC029674 TaxID=3365297 RepID=UPI00384D9BD9